MTDSKLLALQSSLGTAIQEWIDKECLRDEWESLDSYIGNHTSDLMASCAFNILLAQRDITAYLESEGFIK